MFDHAPDFDSLLVMLLHPQGVGFIAAYVGAGALFAGAIFALSVVAVPMILDRRVDPIVAALTSVRLVLAQPLVMLWWAAVVSALVTMALLPGFVGLLVVGPVLGHATWHAYRSTVVPEGARA